MTRSASTSLAALTLAFGAIVLSLTACAAPSSADATPAQQGPTVRQLYHEVEARLAQLGKIYTAVIGPTAGGGGIRQSGGTQVWVDARHDRARVHSTSRIVDQHGHGGQTYTYTAIYANGTMYTHSSIRAPGQPAVQTTPAITCQGAHIAASVVLGCPYFGERVAMSVLSGRFAGRQVLILVSKGTQSGDGTPVSGPFTTWTYVDRQTLLPLAQTGTYTMNKKQAHTASTYVTRMVDPSSLPADFFQPSSLGYRGWTDQIRQSMKSAPPGFRMLWLGPDFAGRQGLPALTLQSASSSGGGGNFDIELQYAPASNRWGDALLYMEEWSSAAASQRPQPSMVAGSTRQTVRLVNGHAVILSGRETMAFAYIGSTIVLVETPTRNAFSSVAAMRAIVLALRPYVPHA